MNNRISNRGFSLIEVLIAVSILALLGVSATGLTSYHKSLISKVKIRSDLYNLADALAVDIVYIIRQTDDEFPSLEENENLRTFKGEYEKLEWEAVLKRAYLDNIPRLFRLDLQVVDKSEKAGIMVYLQSESKEDS